jgi:penicillin-binding protein 1A
MRGLVRFLLKTITILFLLTLTIAVFSLIAGWVIIARLDIDWPTVWQPLRFQPALATEIYDRNGQLLAQLYKDELRYYVPFQLLPNNLISAVIATEDKNFWTHYGVDLEGIGRAFWANFRSGEILEGASTIPQQLARALYLSTETSLKRKATEALLAMRLDATYSKERLLEMYLNQVFLGEGAYGMEAAARTYFGKHVNELTLPECALLAGLIVAPSALSPYQDPQAAKSRQEEVLQRMQRLGFIDQSTLEEALQTPLEYRDSSLIAWKAPYFVDWIRAQLETELDPTLVTQGGLRVYTSLDFNLQTQAEAAVQEGMLYWQDEEVWPKELVDERGIPQPQVALVSLDPKTGEVLAMVGGSDYQKTQFNRALALRQPGSSFKIFDYCAALETGSLKPSDILVSEPIEIEGWSPSEYRDYPGAEKRYYGPLTVRQALVQSSNIAAVKVAMKTGLERVIEIAAAMGIRSSLSPVPSLAIGSNEVQPLEMAQAYAVLAAGGIRREICPILRIETWDGRVIKEWPVESLRVLSENTAFQITDYFTSVIRQTKAYREGLIAAGKTGTTDLFKDAWFCGYTPALATIVWTGCDSASVDFSTRYNIGMYLPASFWGFFMDRAQNMVSNESFPAPSEEMVEVKICSSSGSLASPNCPQDKILWEHYLSGMQPLIICTLHPEKPTVTVTSWPQATITVTSWPQTTIVVPVVESMLPPTNSPPPDIQLLLEQPLNIPTP